MYYLYAKKIIKKQAKQVMTMADKLTNNFDDIIKTLLSCNGKIIISGIGKSGLIGKKLVGTMCSIGYPSVFLHPVEGIHGDVGIVCTNDTVIFISNSGETEELITLLDYLDTLPVKKIVITGAPNSTMARRCDYVLDISVDMEVCPYGICPTSSTTTTLVMGDALAMSLIQASNIQLDQILTFHPGGSIGKMGITVKKMG